MKVRITYADELDNERGFKVGDVIDVRKYRTPYSDEAKFYAISGTSYLIEIANTEQVSDTIDPIVERVLNQFRLRSKQGIETYGTTLQENNLSTLEWINEAQSEAMDFCLYLEKLKDKIKEYDNERENTN